jgi:acyl-coenzyme A synthetase/AMP-(fatty) acid ligase
MLFPSPRYGAEAITKLIEQVDGDILITTSSPFPVSVEILSQRPMRTFTIPSLDELYAAKTEPYPFTKTYAQHKQEPFVCLHTSGTTGFPKPILWTHEWPNANFQGYALLPTDDGVELANVLLGPRNRVMFPFPAFHTSGILAQLFFGLGSGATLILPPAGDTPGGIVENVAATLEYLHEAGEEDITMAALPPPSMEFLSKSPELLEKISARTKKMGFGGGDISDEAGNIISKKMQVVNEYGSTEMGLWPALTQPYPSPEYEWHYTAFHPAVNIRLDPVSVTDEGDEICEAVMVRNGEESGYVQPLFTINKHEEEKNIGDLFIRHPRNPRLWKHHGRSDDLLTFITTEKFHPAAAERCIGSDPAVEEVMMVGTRRPKAALIVRLVKGKSLEDIWETVKEVNALSPVYARVERDMVLVVEEEFLMTAKGTVRKKDMESKYEGDLDRLYRKVGEVDIRVDVATVAP